MVHNLKFRNLYFQKSFYSKGLNNFNSIRKEEEGLSTSTGITGMTKNKRNSKTIGKLSSLTYNLKPKTTEFLNI
jgi:hypothetical protein